ncbi:hypothetical protein X797_002917 [Metarhizium robertsii]|uniref:Extracellular serine-rich protein n=2 Tax=Metarhizium robertsii TaxID=568076 RepID=E9F3H9_METRA|nr:extracellular serine-rich protein [Metarhizium robertsii ARSEF 23]EFY97716.1 extracellular serine-rich protein [Metarhizium robertsii ARSEF 23]EXV05229.1 hypothetical protein X797_002917 [Metarhizium robertsii]
MRSGIVDALTRAACTLCLLGNILPAAAITVGSTVLILARDDAEAKGAAMGLDGYGIPYQKVIFPAGGANLPVLNSSATQGNFGGIVVISNVAYDNNGTFASALTPQQWAQINSYQSTFKVRMVRINEFPSAEFGTIVANTAEPGCCGSNTEQKISLTDISQFPGANLKANAGVSTQGLWHYPATITNTTTTKEVASFEAAAGFASKTTAAVVHSANGREQMVWFISWDPTWSQSSSFLQHAYIHWMTRSLFVGKRQSYLSAQVDDVLLDTELYYPPNTTFKIRPGDLDAHVAWQKNLATRLPAGSDFWLEMGHNGNGNIIGATATTSGETTCKPAYAVDYTSPPDTPLEFMKPPGTGVDLWPAEFVSYTWSATCSKLEPLGAWFTNTNNLNAFAHVSHTFSHEELNNATYHDATREIFFNQAFLKSVGIDRAARFSPKGIIPPAITGLHNADAIKAWTDNGIIYVVGDNTRPVLRNQNSVYWPLRSTVQTNGREGITIIPRFATTIYYNCDLPACTLKEWIDTSGGSGDFNNLLDNARAVNTRNLLSLQADPYMFHQANMRQIDVAPLTIGSQTGKQSLIMAWVETIAQEMTRLTNWPLLSLKHDDLATYFLNRMALDACQPKSSYTYSADGKTITRVTVTANGNTCSAPVPVTFPGGIATTTLLGPLKSTKVGSEPPILWVTLSGRPVEILLWTPVKL